MMKMASWVGEMSIKNATLVWKDDCFGRYSCMCISCFFFFSIYSKVKLTFIYIASKGQGVWICFSLKVTPVVSKKDLCWTEWRSVPG